jgi:hypothetical protein
MTIIWYIWHGAVFRVPISTLRRKKHGGLELTDVAEKCRVLLIARLWAQGKRDGSLTAEWLQFWRRLTTRSNPPNISHTTNIGIPTHLCTWTGVHRASKAGGNPQGIQTKSIQHSAHNIDGGDKTPGLDSHAAPTSNRMVNSVEKTFT